MNTLRVLTAGADIGACLEIPCERATTRRQRRRGLLGRDGIDGVIVLEPCRSVHTFGMRFAIDVAHVRRSSGDEVVVMRVATMKRRRLGSPVPRASMVIEAEAGCFAEWGIVPGVRLVFERE